MSPQTGEWTLRRRLVVTFIVAGALTAVIALITATALGRVINRNDSLLGRIGPARIAGYQMEAALLNQETGVRGYVLTKQTSFLGPYDDGRESETSNLKTLRTSAAGNAELLQDLDEVEAAADAWRSRYAEPLIAAVKAGQPATAVQDDQGKALFDTVRKAIGAFQDDLTTIRNTTYDELQTAIKTLIAIAIAALLLLLLAGAILWRALRRWVLRPLADIGTETRAVVGGALTHQVRVEGPREITALAGHVDAMRSSLVAALSTAVAAQEQLKEQTVQLREQTDQLAAQTEDLQRSNTELEQFAYVASHDLQEPLRKVASFCQMLSRRYSGQLDERGQQYIDFAVDGAKRMQRLINDLLAFSRVGRTTGEFEDVSLDGVLDRALTSLGSTIDESDAVIQSDPLPEVRGNAILLTQVFQNLIGNAIKFHGMAAPRVRITVEERDGVYEFACSDNGIGIEPQYAERVFVIFQRLHGKDQYDGTGIGLAMVRKIIEHHGGRIWLDTDGPATGGTTFRWTLPVPSATEGEPVAVGGAGTESNA
ncbi:sensor histidine kinase [Cryptosporangium phraense]|uniref:histidine kinase n=1 Tax=Cryptosporangium phraense TaxID=2593070 RepID=A0A545ARB1_9ACTN|nr:sensor histidine kinase [Cryptosporangium phraense]TQS43858.1 HAMP domain-containing protein [Cryptosporangium phraense]